jgi:hypothetical protein
MSNESNYVPLLCNLYLFVDFTVNQTIPSEGYKSSPDNASGFTHMAAAYLALYHFNTRNSTVVPQLVDAIIKDCPIRLDMNRSKVFDTATIGHYAAQQFLDAVITEASVASIFYDDDNDDFPFLDSFENNTTNNRRLRDYVLPCAMAGPNSDFPALELSVQAASGRIPLVATRSFNTRVVKDEFSPYSHLVWPDVVDTAKLTVDFIKNGLHRTDYIEMVYTISDTNIQRREILASTLDAANITHYNARPMWIQNGTQTTTTTQQLNDMRSPNRTLRAIRDGGYRTIIVFVEDTMRDVPPIAEAADALGMNTGDYLWIWFGSFDTKILYTDNPIYNKLLYGSGLVMALDPFLLHRKKDIPHRFTDAWKTVPPEFIQLVNEANPIPEGEVGYVYANETFFQDTHPDFGAGFYYDAVMSIGIGACAAYANNDLSSEAHVRGIRQSEFVGATGTVKFLNGQGRSGARDPLTVPWVGFNILPGRPGLPSFEIASHWMNNETENTTAQGWTEETPFIFADGTSTGPLLRDTPDQNYLTNGLRILGISLMGIVWLSSIISSIWVYRHRSHRILAASQPVFLYLLAFGCFVQSSTILVLSFDESTGWSEQALSSACAAAPWLLTLGHILIYGALSCKLYRVNKVLQFARRKIQMWQVVWPLVLLFLSAVIILSVWTAVDTRTWERTEINDETGESIGQCSRSDYFLVPLIFLMLLPTVMTGVMAWKTKDVSEDYSEARWIWIMIIVQFEVFLVAAPTVIVLRDVSTDGRYLGSTFLLWIYPMSALSLIIFPKYLAYRRHERGIVDRPKRGELVGVRVSGLESTVDRPNVASASQVVESSFMSQDHQ